MDDSPQIKLKQCPYREEFKPATTEFFYVRKDRPCGLQTKCKACISAKVPAKPKVIVDHTGEKRCAACREWKPATREHFYAFSRTSDGLGETCIPCMQERHPKPTTKYCAKCEQHFPATADFFYPRRTQINGPGLQSTCKSCAAKKREREKEYMIEWRKSHPEKLSAVARRRVESGKAREDSRRYNQTHPERRLQQRAEYNRKYPTRRAEITKRYREHHPEEVKQRSQRYHQTERYKEHVRRYQKAHPEIIRTNNRNRIARKRAATGKHTIKDVRRQYAAQRGKCYYCQAKLAKYHVDHIVPLIRGGSNSPENLVVTCPTCNLRKHARLPHEWPEGNRLL